MVKVAAVVVLLLVTEAVAFAPSSPVRPSWGVTEMQMAKKKKKKKSSSPGELLFQGLMGGPFTYCESFH